MSLDISGASDIGGFIAACVVDSDSGLMLVSEGGGGMDLEAAAALNTQVVKAKLQGMDVMGSTEALEDIMITMSKQIHLLRPIEAVPSTFLYVVLDKKSANLGMARLQIRKIEGTLSLN